jgi:hypothetical protein
VRSALSEFDWVILVNQLEEPLMTTSSTASKLNVGRHDRSIRVVVGILLLTLAVFSLSGAWATIAGVMGLFLMGTGFFGFCPIYRLLGTSTCPVR